ncbi:hypothetical protein HMPREF9714_01349 [Myroides odoratimimus CCUG 12901]|nr:hypothetical protein HMPREF9714_01349 [Myroides odoratimimus CCUG 12901]
MTMNIKGQNNIEKYKVINESEQYSLQIYELYYNKKLPSKYWQGYEKFYPSLINGEIGTIDFEFDHPNGFRLAIFKSDGFEDKYKVIAKSALGNLTDIEIPKPKIIWNKLPVQTNKLEEELSGKIIANGNIVEFKLNQEQIPLNKDNEFVYKIKVYPGRNAIDYYISTDTKTGISDYIIIENISNIQEEIYNKLLSNNFLHLSKEDEKQKSEIESVKINLSEGYFYPPSFQVYFDIELEYLVESGFKYYLTEISNGLKKLGCKADVGIEYQTMNNEKKSFVKEEEIHWIEFNEKKEIIWKGNKKDKNSYEIYLKKLIELTNKVLEESKREERVYQITSYDGVLICLLTEEKYLLLKEICKPLKNKFID